MATHVPVTTEAVRSCFARLSLHKAPGPDGLRGRVLMECASQLGHVFARLFQLFLDTKFVPLSWKLSTVIPVPKKAHGKEMNDFRPVALTSIFFPSAWKGLYTIS